MTYTLKAGATPKTVSTGDALEEGLHVLFIAVERKQAGQIAHVHAVCWNATTKSLETRTMYVARCLVLTFDRHTVHRTFCTCTARSFLPRLPLPSH